MAEKQNESKCLEDKKISHEMPFSEETTEDLIFTKLIYSKISFLFQSKFSFKIIEFCLDELKNKTKITIRNKIRMRNVSYLGKFLKNNREIKIKNIFQTEEQRIISQFFILFAKNIMILISKYKNEKTKENFIKIIYLYNLFTIILNEIGISYISGAIKDDYFELLIKNILCFSFEKSVYTKDNYINDWLYKIFFNECISIIKIIFNKIYLIKKNYSQKQKEIIRNIIIFINSNIFGSSSEINSNFHSNKCFLYKNDFKTSSLIDLAHIITKMESIEVSECFISLLTNIYSFSFNYENSMKPILKLIEPLLLHLNNKDINEIHNEFKLSDFTLNYLNELNNKEKDLLKHDRCLLKEGFYFGNKSSVIYGDLNTPLVGDFAIIFGIKLESEKLDNTILFELFNEEKSLVKFIINKNLKNHYELIAQFESKDSSTNVIIKSKKTYIFSFFFTTEGLFHQSFIKIKYIKDDNTENEDLEIYSGANIKYKNINNINKFCFGCDRIRKKRQNTFENKFNGFIGDVIILNVKHNKGFNDSKLFEEILKLKYNYGYIIKLLSEKNNIIQADCSYKEEYNSTFNDIKKIYENIQIRNEFKTNITINTILKSKYFKLIDYQDDINYINSFNSYKEYSNKLEIPISIDMIYFDNIIKNESKNKKIINMNSSIFNKDFHIFERKYSLVEFIKYEGIQYLSLLFEYYYQILCYLIEIKNNNEQNILNDLYKDINQKIKNILNFFNSNIIQTNRYEYNMVSIEQFFYQMSKTIFKFIEIKELDFETIKCIIEIINSLDKNTDINKKESFQVLSSIKLNLILVLINPRLYNKESSSNLENLNYVLLYLLTILKIIKIDNMSNLYYKNNLEILMSYFWLLDETKEDELIKETKKNYISLLILFLQISTSIEFKEKYNKINQVEENNETSLISEFFLKSLEYRKNKNIFFHLTLILVKTNFVSFLKESVIQITKSLLLNENKFGQLNNSEYKKTIYFSYLQILIAYYFSETEYKSNEASIQIFNDFINNLILDMDLFYAFIAIISQIKNFRKLNKINLDSYKLEEIKIISKNEYPKFNDLPFLDIKLDKLNDMEIYIIKSILLNIFSLIEKFPKNIRKVLYPNNESNSTTNISLEIFQIIKKNIDIVFKYPKIRFFETIFSSDSNLCSLLLDIKVRTGQKEDINYIKTVIKKYYKELVKNTYCPFIFKFLLNISNIKINGSNIEYDIVNDLKGEIIINIIETLKDVSNELEKSKDSNIMPYYIYNLLNCLILLNEELNYKSNILYDNNKFYDAVYTFISLISEGLLYSNYCIEFKDGLGKIISEIILDIFMAIPAKYFKRNLFIKTFIKSKEKLTVFCIMDSNKEIKKSKNNFNFPELDKVKEINNIISLNQKNIKISLVEENNMYQINDVNFMLYFIAKSFVYLRTNFIKDKINEIKANSLNILIPCLSDDLYNLYTKNKIYYVSKNSGFPLYNETKKYFESYIIQNYNFKGAKSNELFKKFFDNDLFVILKDEYNIDYCFSSKLKKSKENNFNLNKIEENNIISEQKPKISLEKRSEISISDTSTINTTFSEKISNSNQTFNNADMSFRMNSSFIISEELKEKDESNYNELFQNSFEKINKYIILHPRNYFLKKIFSNVYKDMIFFNKQFINIKKIYLTKFKDLKGLVKESKQIDYPSKQKNYSNFLEPRIFLKRDFNFYDEKFFPISHQYLPNNIKNKQLEELFFYKNKLVFNKNNSKIKVVCELVTNQYIYFGYLYFYEKYMIFETDEDPRNNPDRKMDINIFINYSISTKIIDNSLSKYKFIIIFYENIQEMIKRRSLLVTQSLEIFLKNGKSYFFNFFRTKNAKKVYDFLEEAKNKFSFIFDLNNNQKDIKNISYLFHTGKISNYDYILYLNQYSTRTYCDLSQYPVFPWLAMKYDNTENIDEPLNNLRNLKYPISVQNEEKRKQVINNYKSDYENFEEENEEDKDKEYPAHFNVHYSSSAVIYYYLMRLNPYGRNLIKLQNYHNENPNRMFTSNKNIEHILTEGYDNRELIPDFFCYFDFLINLNCNYFGQIIDGSLNDDFNIELNKIYKNKNVISKYVYHLYRNKKILNSLFVSKNLHEWVDIIFGKKQLLEDDNEEAAESCNIYSKYSYEQRTDFEKELQLNEKILNNKNIKKEELKRKIIEIESHLKFTINFGMTPKKILKNTITYEGENKTINDLDNNIFDKIIYYSKLENDEYIILKYNTNIKDKNKTTNIEIDYYKNKNLIENNTFEFKNIDPMMQYKTISIKYEKKEEKLPLYNSSYSISYIDLKISKKNRLSNIVILSCRYLGNYFNIQSFDKNINVSCEDFVTCIKGNNKETSNIFYTGLFNGKLIEWEIDTNLELKEIKNIYSHTSSITAVELNNRQNIIITAGEDKIIHIRKQYDFELLTSINLCHYYSNMKISMEYNIFPSLIKISDLNLLYVLIYDLESETNFIRGYNLNGLFFAEIKNDSNTKDKNKKYIMNSISFTKNSNLIVGYYNLNKFALLQSWDLIINKLFDIQDKFKREGTQMVIYESSPDILNFLYNDQLEKLSLKENDKLCNL